jgi:hypothetical protein
MVGVIWDPPEDPSQAILDLRAMARTGISVVRVPAPMPTPLLAASDSLGIRVFQDLSARFLTGAELAASAASLQSELALVERSGLTAAVGLAVVPQSGDAATCGVLERLSAATSLLSYIVSWNPSPDPCSDSVDFVLYDSPGHGAENSTVLGKSADHDPFDQARFLASRLADARTSQPVLIFRWRDQRSVEAYEASPGEGKFGLETGTGQARPARVQLRRMIGEGQFEFDMPPPLPARPASNRTIIMGWLVLVVLLGLYVRSPRLKPMVIRYFVGHGFYRTAVLETQGTMTGTSLTILACFGVICGLLFMQALRVIPELGVYHVLWNWSPRGVRSTADSVLAAPTWPVIVLSTGIVAAGLARVLLVRLVLGRRPRLVAGQILILTIWPLWAAFAVLPIIMIASGLPLAGAGPILRPLLPIVAGLLLWGAVRANLDLTHAARAGPLATVMLWVLSPALLVAAAAVFFLSLKPGVGGYLWYVATI